MRGDIEPIRDLADGPEGLRNDFAMAGLPASARSFWPSVPQSLAPGCGRLSRGCPPRPGLSSDARPEGQHAARADRHLFAGLRVAPHPRGLGPHRNRSRRTRSSPVRPPTSASDINSSTRSTSCALSLRDRPTSRKHRFGQIHPCQCLASHHFRPQNLDAGCVKGFLKSIERLAGVRLSATAPTSASPPRPSQAGRRSPRRPADRRV